MKLPQINITIRDIVEDYYDDNEGGITGYNGKLDIRPPYQREFIYKGKMLTDVIDTILNGFHLNTMYWADKGDGTYEVIDGQQRTLSICKFVEGEFFIEYGDVKCEFDNLPNDIQERFLDYELTVFLCQGTDSEKLEWFKRINKGGLKLKPQEMRNAIYSGAWLSDAKRYFSNKTQGASDSQYAKYLNGDIARQEYLQKVIKWHSNNNIEKYMAEHQHDKNAKPLWEYFLAVVAWAESIFPEYHKDMKKVDWGLLYNEYKDKEYNPGEIAKEVKELRLDKNTLETGIYAYIITGERKHIHKRFFDKKTKTRVYAKQEGICPRCQTFFEEGEMEADHIMPWEKGGETTEENCQMLCKQCNGEKGAR